MFGERIFKEVEALNFRKVDIEGPIICDDPEIWVKDCRGSWQETDRFVLAYAGNRIGFSEPLEEELFAELAATDWRFDMTMAEPYAGRPRFQIIGKLCIPLSCMDFDKGQMVDATGTYRFKSVDEQDYALAIIQAALAQRNSIGRHAKETQVIFSRSLTIDIQRGKFLVTADKAPSSIQREGLISGFLHRIGFFPSQ